jgi:hypothetical protein
MEHESITKTGESKIQVHGPGPTTISPDLTSYPLLQIQRALGNRNFGRFIQAKLTVSQADDPFEREADSIADQVMRMPALTPLDTALTCCSTQVPEVQRKCGACKEELPASAFMDSVSEPQLARKCTECAEEEREELLLKESPGGSTSVQSIVRHGTAGGQPLDSSVRAFFEPKFGYAFDGVRIHTSGPAAESARAVNAQAYTIGRDIVFGAGQYQPQTNEGKRLLAHELTHVIQQGGRSSLRRIHRAEDSSETAAETPGQTESPSARLHKLIEAIEEVYGRASQAVNRGQAPDANASGAAAAIAGLAGPVNMIPGVLIKLREVANGDNEELKLQTLAAFSPTKVREATDEVERSHHVGQTTPVAVQEEESESVATSRLDVSHPQDAEELEAVRVADAVVFGGPVEVGQTAHGRVIHRSNGAVAALAGLTAFELGGGAELEAATGPPGWVVGAVVLVAIAGLAIYVASTTTTTTAPPIAVPVPTTVPTTVAPPVAATRTRPGQTCDDARLAVLEAAKTIACAGPFSCSDATENLGKRNERLLSCAQLLANIAAINACLAARNLIQSECFTGSPEAGHAAQVAQLTNALRTCTAKALARGC